MLTREEFENSLVNTIEFWGALSKEEVAALIGEDVAKMVNFDQRNPHHCYTLFMHILHTVGHLPENAPILLKVAAFFHDIGKTYVAKEKQGRLVFYGHAAKSVKIARPILQELGYAQIELEEICFYIQHHDDFISWSQPDEISQKNVRKHMQKTQEKREAEKLVITKIHWNNLLDLCRADAMSQSETAILNGKIVATKEEKIAKTEAIRQKLQSI